MKTLFICSANVGRSQMAEGYYNYFTNSNNGTSAALIEDRRKKYDNKPASSIIDIMKEDGIDISFNEIKLLTKEICDTSDRIILLLKPNIHHTSEFTINGERPTEFLLENYRDKIQIKEIQDPFGEGLEKLRAIRNEIKTLIQGLL